MFQITLRGHYELNENPQEFLKEIEEIAKKYKAELNGEFRIFTISPYIDYQVADVTDAQA
jgi:hypothetical protein